MTARAAMQMVDAALPLATHTTVCDTSLAVTISLICRAGENGEPSSRRAYFEGDATGIEAKSVRALKGDSAWPLALIRADRQAPCGLVSILLQCLQGLGFGQLAFVIHSGE